MIQNSNTTDSSKRVEGTNTEVNESIEGIVEENDDGTPISRNADAALPNQEQYTYPQHPKGSSTALSPPLDKLESSTDLQFKKKDYQRCRTLLFQSVLSSASLKSLKHQYITPKPNLERNASNLLQYGIKNFQSYIQAPVLLLVTNPRRDDDVVIGQRLPFDVGSGMEALSTGDVSNTQDYDGANIPNSSNNEQTTSSGYYDDIYKEETTLQQQKLTLNALKKLSLSLAPIIYCEDEDEGGDSIRIAGNLQISSKPLISRRTASTNVTVNGIVPVETISSVANSKNNSVTSLQTTNKGSKPYIPAEVDLSQFSSLTRQSRLNTADERQPQLPALVNQESKLPYSLVDSERLKQEIQRVNFADNVLRDPSTSMRPLEKELDAKKKAGLKLDFTSLPSLTEKINGLRNQPTNFGDHNPIEPHSHSRQKNGIDTRNSLFELYVGRPTHKNADKISSNLSGMVNHALPLKKLQQINGFRSPMYVPAVLRKTETDEDAAQDTYFATQEARTFLQASSSAPPLATTSVSSAALIQSTDLVTTQREGNSGYVNGNSQFYGMNRTLVSSRAQNKMSNNGIVPATTGPYPLHQNHVKAKGKGGINYLHHHLHIINAPPTRHHWLRDESVAKCGITSCGKSFNFFERRHHCRKCGGIFCKEHVLHFLYINHLAQFTAGERGTLSRVCVKCAAEYKEFASRREILHIRPSNADPTHFPVPSELASSGPGSRSQDIYNQVASTADETPKDPVVGSVPANWSWSSF